MASHVAEATSKPRHLHHSTGRHEAEYGKFVSKDLLRGLEKGKFVDELAER
jgi:hypothetical protein